MSNYDSAFKVAGISIFAIVVSMIGMIAGAIIGGIILPLRLLDGRINVSGMKNILETINQDQDKI